jgi:hypothetical protein
MHFHCCCLLHLPTCSTVQADIADMERRLFKPLYVESWLTVDIKRPCTVHQAELLSQDCCLLHLPLCFTVQVDLADMERRLFRPLYVESWFTADITTASHHSVVLHDGSCLQCLYSNLMCKIWALLLCNRAAAVACTSPCAVQVDIADMKRRLFRPLYVESCGAQQTSSCLALRISAMPSLLLPAPPSGLLCRST